MSIEMMEQVNNVLLERGDDGELRALLISPVGRTVQVLAQRLTVIGAVVAAAACASAPTNDEVAPARPLPVPAMTGVEVVVYPLTMILAEASLGWDGALTPRDSALQIADSLLAALLAARTPEVTWVYPDELRRVARRAPGLLVDPDRLATAALRHNLAKIPDPLRSQMRSLTGAAGDRLSLVPASLHFFRAADDVGRAELTVVVVDVRLGDVWWRSVVRGTGPDPWTALREALNTLAPGV